MVCSCEGERVRELLQRHGLPSDRESVDFLLRHLAAMASSLPGVRKDVVERVRREIRSGNYETLDKMEKAADALLEDLFPTEGGG